MSASNTFASQAPIGLPLDGFSRWSDLRPFVPLSRETVRTEGGHIRVGKV